MDLGGQVALVTGASRGIGRSIALMLGGRGATVVGTATTDAGAQSITAYLSQAQIRGNGAQLDVRIAENVERLVAEIEQAHGAVSILVNNAGIARDNLAMRMKEDEWDAVIDTNLKSVFRLCKAVMRGMMKARSGRVINITSVVGSSGNAGQINYAAAKAGITGLTRSLAREIGSRSITVNCVAPGFIDTDMTRILTDAQRAALLQQIPLGRLGNPEDVAAATALSANPGWAQAISRAGRQASNSHVFHDALTAFLPADADKTLLAGDDNTACADFDQLISRLGFAPVLVRGLRDGGKLMQLGGPLSTLHVIKQD